jgi:hypothetical protein
MRFAGIMGAQIMLVYHGGYALIDEIDLEKCRPYTDLLK